MQNTLELSLEERIKEMDIKGIEYDKETIQFYISIMNDTTKHMKERIKSMNHLTNYLNIISFYKS